MAYGPLNLKPSELAVLTPAELRQLFDGYRWRRRIAMTDQAWTAATLVNASRDIVSALTGKSLRYVKASDFLPADMEGATPPLTVEQVQRELQEKVKRFAAAAEKRKKENPS